MVPFIKIIITGIISSICKFYYRFTSFYRKQFKMSRSSFIVLSRICLKKGNSISLGSFARIILGRVQVDGIDNIIEIKGIVKKGDIVVSGRSNSITIDKGVLMNGCHIVVRGNECKLAIGASSTFGKDTWFVVMGNNNCIIIGEDCMIADMVDFWATDSHPIFSEKQLGEEKIVNPSGKIVLEDHVWVGKKSVILKNVTIRKNAIIGMNTTVKKDVPEGSVAVGAESRIVRNNINWSREHIQI